MEYVALVLSYVLYWWNNTPLQLGSVYIPSVFAFIVAIWIFKTAVNLILDYFFE